LTGKIPFDQFRKLTQFILAFTSRNATPIQPSKKGSRVTLPEGAVSKVAERCWEYDPKMRPTAEEVQSILAVEVKEDDRPSVGDEATLFLTAKQSRSEAKVDYGRVFSILQRVSMQRRGILTMLH
jgi:hypothetical protein